MLCAPDGSMLYREFEASPLDRWWAIQPFATEFAVSGPSSSAKGRRSWIGLKALCWACHRPVTFRLFATLRDHRCRPVDLRAVLDRPLTDLEEPRSEPSEQAFTDSGRTPPTIVYRRTWSLTHRNQRTPARPSAPSVIPTPLPTRSWSPSAGSLTSRRPFSWITCCTCRMPAASEISRTPLGLARHGPTRVPRRQLTPVAETVPSRGPRRR